MYLIAAYTGGTLVMENVKVLFERFQAFMPKDTPHALWTVTKSVVGLLASQLIEEGEPDPKSLGVHGQMIHINPKVGLVVVRLSSHPIAANGETLPTTIPALEALADLLRDRAE